MSSPITVASASHVTWHKWCDIGKEVSNPTSGELLTAPNTGEVLLDCFRCENGVVLNGPHACKENNIAYLMEVQSGNAPAL